MSNIWYCLKEKQLCVMNRRLIKGTLIYAIGNFGTKVLSLIIVPLYTYVISTSDFGIYDYYETIISLLVPFVSINVNDAIITWMLDQSYSKYKVIKATLMIISVSFLLIGSLGTIIWWKNGNQYICFILVILVSRTLFSIIQQFVRGFGKQTFYAFSGIIYSGVLLGANVILVFVLRKGIDGLLISEIIAPIVGTMFLILTNSEILSSLTYNIDFDLMKRMILFSLPMIPNAVSWWVVGASDRFFILHFLGTSANGVYSIANKFATTINLLTGFFALAWQEVGIVSFYEDKGKEIFENVIKEYSTLLFTALIVILPLTRWLILLFDEEYYAALYFIGILCMASVFSALAAFFNVIYMSSRRTGLILKTTLVAAIVNILINYWGIKTGGLYVASISTLVSYIILFGSRCYVSSHFYGITIDLIRVLFLFLIGSVYVILPVVCKNSILLMVAETIAIAIFIYANRRIICSITTTFLRKKKK